jgi:membrane protease YdiL (CAAX protease family)
MFLGAQITGPEATAWRADFLVLLLGLPFLAIFLWRLRKRRDPWATIDGAWPDVCWGERESWYVYLAAFIIVREIVSGGITFGVLPWVIPEGLEKRAPSLYIIYNLAASILQWVIICSLILIYLARRHRVLPATFGLTLSRFWPSAKAGAFTLLAATPLITAVLFTTFVIYYAITGHEPTAALEHPILLALRTHPPLGQTVVVWVLTGLVTPFFEELFFRGLVQTTLMRTGRPWAAIGISALVFAMAHVGVPLSMPGMLVLGLALGYTFYRTRSLASCIVMHALFNLFNMALTALQTP